MEEMTYEKAGVSIAREERGIRGIKLLLEKTFKFREGKVGEVFTSLGHYANLISLGDFYVAFTMDGVGSKILVAEELKKYGTIGIDLVAMNVNDLICVGAEPVAMVDYIAMQKIDENMMKEIAYGIYEGAKKAGIAIVGGETATLPEMIAGIGENCFDLVGAAIGIVKKEEIVTGEKIRPGDVVLGLASSGIHSNGLTLARKVLPKNMWVDLLKPTRIYVKEFLELRGKFEILGAAHITGGGFRNLLRLGSYGFYLDNMPDPPMIFKKIKELGNVSNKEMYKTFNMGVGFCIITSKQDAEKILLEYGERFKIRKLGEVIDEKEVRIKVGDEEIILK